jgi:hypothetical protein
MDTDTVPRLLPPGKAPLLKNFLMDRPGVLPMRGPICEGVTWNLGASIGLQGLWVHDDNILVSRSGTSAVSLRDYWVNPYRKADTTSFLRTCNATMKHISIQPTGDVLTNVASATADDRIGLKGIRIGAYVYGYGGTAATNRSIVRAGYPPTYNYNLTKLLRWSGSTSAPAVYVNAPVAAQDVAYHYNRLFVLGGEAIGTTDRQVNSLYWSPTCSLPTAPACRIGRAWQDDVSGLANQLVVGSRTTSDFGVALAHVGAEPLILKRRSLWMLYGTAPSNFQVKQV